MQCDAGNSDEYSVLIEAPRGAAARSKPLGGAGEGKAGSGGGVGARGASEGGGGGGHASIASLQRVEYMWLGMSNGGSAFSHPMYADEEMKEKAPEPVESKHMWSRNPSPSQSLAFGRKVCVIDVQ